jgi:uncharacterized small protein (DUF1192 family)
VQSIGGPNREGAMREDEFGYVPKKQVVHEIGSDLASLSEHELTERIELLKAEIDRLDAEAARKAASREAASAFFKS